MAILTRAIKALIERGGKILLLQRSKELRGDDNWDLPGGLKEGDETDKQALAREALEELGIEIIVHEIKGEWSFVRTLDNKRVAVTNYRCELRDPNAVVVLSSEHQDLAWIAPQEIGNFRLKDPSLIESAHKEYHATKEGDGLEIHNK